MRAPPRLKSLNLIGFLAPYLLGKAAGKADTKLSLPSLTYALTLAHSQRERGFCDAPTKTFWGFSLCVALSFQPLTVSSQRRTHSTCSAATTVNVNTTRPTNRFTPAHAFGGGIDGHDKGVTDLQLTGANIKEMLSAGLTSLTYRLRTELANDVWHWNPQGQWSDESRKQGYWISDAQAAAPISLSYGFRLPRRGNTIDQANNEGYSRLDDGDETTFWKSNPYLDRYFTGESNSLHPQWMVIEFERPTPINGVRLLWGVPFATRYRIQYANFDDVSDIGFNPPGLWRDFPRHSKIRSAKAESTGLLRLSQTPIKIRWLRILMTESSGTGPIGSRDVRDRLGFALKEVYAGVIDNHGEFYDQLRHGLDRRRQTIFHVSSTDPWHREIDQDDGVEQPGLDRVYQSGLTNGRPLLLPVGLLFDTPENAAGEISYLRSRGYQFDRVELGEEPDGQYITPEDFGALYLQWADAIHRVDPNLKLGGPSFQEILPDDQERAFKLGNSEWLRRFLDYLKRRGCSSDYSFFSFEWYPFDDVCEPVAPQLLRAPKILANSLREMQRRGLSRRIPWIISEYGYSAYAARAELTMEGALLNADIVGRFLSLGGDQAFLFGYTPGYVNRDEPCTAGNNMLFSMDGEGNISHRFATYFGARLLTQQWAKPGDEWHELFPARVTAKNRQGDELITAYALKRPDDLWSLLLINKDPKRTIQTNIIFHNTRSGAHGYFLGSVDLYQYSDKQYVLGGPDSDPYPVKADEPEHRVIQSSQTKATQITLPPYSLTVIRGRLN